MTNPLNSLLLLRLRQNLLLFQDRLQAESLLTKEGYLVGPVVGFKAVVGRISSVFRLGVSIQALEKEENRNDLMNRLLRLLLVAGAGLEPMQF